MTILSHSSPSATRDWFGRVYTHVSRRIALAQTRKSLHALPDSILHDIGIHRSEITGIAGLERLKHRL